MKDDTAHPAVDFWYPSEWSVPFLKGRVALHALLRAAGVGPGTEVLIPGFTCVVVPAAVIYCGATPVYYDVSLESFNGSAIDARAKLTSRTRVILVQHTFGVMSDPAPFERLRDDFGITLLEDCAHAIGSSYGGRAAGTIGAGSFTSLQWSKMASCGLGGIAHFNDPQLLKRFHAIAHDYLEPSTHTQLQLQLLTRLRETLSDPRLFWAAQSLYRATARVGLVPGSSTHSELLLAEEPSDYRRRFGRQRSESLNRALDSVSSGLKHRSAIATQMRECLALAGAPLQRLESRAQPTFLRVAALVQNKYDLLVEARRSRIELGDWFDAPLHPANSRQEAFGYQVGSCPNGEWLSTAMINLPTHSRIGFATALRLTDWLQERAQFATIEER